MTTPSKGRDCMTVKATSPVPGGISMKRKSNSPQITSFQNCFTTFPTTGPLHTTGSFSSSSSKFKDITLIPSFVNTGNISVSETASALSSRIPVNLGILGPVMSPSKIPTLYPLVCSSFASKTVTVDFPTPPFPLITPITFFILFKGLVFFSPQVAFFSVLHPLEDGQVLHPDILLPPYSHIIIPYLDCNLFSRSEE